jgi:hypothetical protein
METDDTAFVSPPAKLTRSMMRGILGPTATHAASKRSLTDIERIHHGVLTRRQVAVVNASGHFTAGVEGGPALPTGAAEDISYYESTFREFLTHAERVPQLRIVVPYLEDVWGAYTGSTRQVYDYLAGELESVRGRVDEFKGELESWKEMALMYRDKNEALTRGAPEEDEKYQEMKRSMEASREESARLADELNRTIAEHSHLLGRHRETCREADALSVRVGEMEVARQALTPRPVLSLPDLGDAQSTVEKIFAFRDHYDALATENARLNERLSSCLELEEKRSLARQKLEEEARLEPKGSIHKYLDMLEDKGEEVWRDQLIGMGVGGDVPKLFRFGGKIRNKHMSKRDTEKMVREVWKDRLASLGSKGSSALLVDFLGGWLQKKVGIAAAVLELGYNFLFGLWKYQWDADCELFLKVLVGDIREEVYISQNKLQVDLEELFEALDKLNGQATGSIPKDELIIALRAFFKVGKLDGKSEDMFRDALGALESDQPGTLVEWRKVFEEDREFNQGAFAECIREQFLTERKHLNDAVAVSLYVACGGTGGEGDGTDDGDAGTRELRCTREQFAQALMDALPLLRDEEADMHASKVFEDEADEILVKKALKVLGEGNLTTAVQDPVAPVTAGPKKQRAAGTATGKSKKQSHKQHSALINLALESVRLSWVAEVGVAAEEAQ